MEKSLPQSVLIVDDEAHVRLYIRMLLKNMGIEQFVEGGNGKEGVELYREYRPDLALFDINMPILDGLSALKEILGEDPKAKVIMMTAEATRQAVEISGETGAVQFIRKDTPKAENRYRAFGTLLGVLACLDCFKHRRCCLLGSGDSLRGQFEFNLITKFRSLLVTRCGRQK